MLNRRVFLIRREHIAGCEYINRYYQKIKYPLLVFVLSGYSSSSWISFSTGSFREGGDVALDESLRGQWHRADRVLGHVPRGRRFRHIFRPSKVILLCGGENMQRSNWGLRCQKKSKHRAFGEVVGTQFVLWRMMESMFLRQCYMFSFAIPCYVVLLLTIYITHFKKYQSGVSLEVNGLLQGADNS